MSDCRFFGEKQAAAVLKHGLLGRYMRTFCSKTGSTSTGHRVIYLDGYAGQGVYDDGQDGSPALVARTAGTLASIRDVFGVYVEKRPATAGRLSKFLSQTGHGHVVLCGALEETLPKAMSYVHSGDPLFAFFDPFGLPIAMDAIAGIMEHAQMGDGRRSGPPTEILVTLSYPGIRRNAGHLTATSRNPRYKAARAAKLESLDLVLDGDWWRKIWLSGGDERVELIADGYRTRLGERLAARGWYCVPVARYWEGPTVYELLFYTQYPEQGIWFFNECTSLAVEDFRQFCTRDQLDFDPLDARETRWTRAIKENIVSLLDGRAGLIVSRDMGQIYGSTLGYAREKHLRVALKQLHTEGRIRQDGKGKLSSSRIDRR